MRVKLKYVALAAAILVLVGVLIWIFCSRYAFIGNDKIPIDSTKVRLDLSNCKIDRSLKRLKNISQMDILDLYMVSDDDSLEYISLPDSLTKIIVSCSKIDDASFVNSIGDRDICFFQTEVDLSNISNETSINKLRLYASKVLNFEKAADCRTIKCLDIYKSTFGNDNPDEDPFDSTILGGFDYVTTLELGGMEITDISGLLEMQSLRDLKIYENSISDKQLAELQGAGINVEMVPSMK